MNDKEIKQSIFETTNYDQFKFIPGNRPIKMRQVERLRDSMLKNGFFPDQAIGVNKDFTIADGQHRLLAAKEEGIPVLYKFLSETVDISGVQKRNTAVPWGTGDFLQSYVALGNKKYITLADFAKEYNLSVAISLGILSMKHGASIHRSALSALKSDDWQIEDYDHAEQLASLVSEVRRYTPDGCFSHRYCIRALAILMDQVDPKLLFQKMKQYQQVITRRQSVKDYLLEFENILNQGNTGKQIELT